MKFEYRGMDRAGGAVAGTLEAADASGASDVLLRRGVYASSVTPARQAPAPSRGGGSGLLGRRRERTALFLRQLAVLVGTGTTLVEAIESVERQTGDREFAGVLADVRRRVEEGSQLSEAVASHPRYFDGVARSLIAAGESSGRLDAMLHRLSQLLRRQVKVRKTVVGAMVYPALLTCVALGVLATMTFFVLPRFEGLFQTLDAPLPASTRLLLDMGSAARSYWWAILGVLILLGAGAWVLMSSRVGRDAWAAALLRTPQVGRAVKSFSTARIARLLGVLLEAKVPLMEALGLVKASVSHPAYAGLMARAEDAVSRGESVGAVFALSDLISPTVSEALRSGERSGQVAAVLSSIADFLDEDNEVLVKTLTGMIEPLILIFMGVTVGAVAISLFLPLFDLTSAGVGGPG